MKKVLVASILSCLSLTAFAEESVKELTKEELVLEQKRNEAEKALKYQLFESDVKESLSVNAVSVK